MFNRVFHVVLIALLALAATAVAGPDTGVTAPRIWSPAGDVIGATNQATVTFRTLDAYGDAAKLAEDTGLVEETFGAAVFGWRKTTDSGYLIDLRGLGSTADGEGLSGHFALAGGRTGQHRYRIDIRRFNAFSDTDSELRDALFGNPPPPPALAAVPVLEWRRSDVALGWRPTDAVALRLGLRRVCRDGERGSLLRTATGNTVPGVKGYDQLKSQELSAGLTWAGRRLAVDVDGALRVQDGDRTLGTTRTWSEDRTSYRVTAGARWQAATGTQVHGAGTVAKLENKGSEVFGADAITPAGETSTQSGQLGFIHRLSPVLTVRGAARFESAETDAAAVVGAAPATSSARERTRQDYRLAVSHTGFKATRLDLRFRLRASNLEETVVDGATFMADEDRTESELVFKARHRFSRRALLKVRAEWASLDREQLRDWSDPSLRYWMDDYKRDRIGWRAALQLRPSATVRLDVGHRYADSTFENQITAGVETCRRRSEAYANLNWTANDWLTLYGTVSLGNEKLEIGDEVAPDPGMGALNTDATTLRVVPGATARLTDRLSCEAMYEGIRYEDEGDAGAVLGTLQSDHDRVLLRAAYRLDDTFTVSATYRRAEFFEHRWDNAIADLYGMSVTGRF